MKSDPMRVNICYIGGGSRNWAWILMKDLALEREIGGEVHLYDIDEAAASDNEELGNKLMAANAGTFRFKAMSSLERALDGSDFVFISILPGDFEEMAVDVHLPEKFGIWQSVGDTVGPGGLNRALRTVPMYERIARAIAGCAPDAWVLNYTNPMSVCTRALYATFPGMKAFGCCHEVFNAQILLRKIAVRAGLAAEGDIRREDVSAGVSGINHFTFFDRASWRGVDLFPLWDGFVAEFGEAGFPDGIENEWDRAWFTSGERVKMDLYRRFGLIAAAGDRHLAEFCPPSWYLKDPDTARAWQFRLTPVDFRVNKRDELRRKSEAYRRGLEEMVPERSGEEGIRQVKALLGLGDLVTNVNLPNEGQMPGLPAGAVVETNALFRKDSVRPVVAGAVPGPLLSLMLQHVENQEGILKAAAARSLEDALLVFMNDPQVRGLSPADARRLLAEMTARTLPEYMGYGRLSSRA
jgi:galacturan 1,4-alpha-galacturonidase